MYGGITVSLLLFSFQLLTTISHTTKQANKVKLNFEKEKEGYDGKTKTPENILLEELKQMLSIIRLSCSGIDLHLEMHWIALFPFFNLHEKEIKLLLILPIKTNK